MPKKLTTLIILLVTAICAPAAPQDPGRHRAKIYVKDHVLYIDTIAIKSCTKCSDAIAAPPWHRQVWERHKTLAVYALLFLIVAAIMYGKWKKLKPVER